ncbi:MAG: hypothetical protein R2912_03175 [Eubacteriales bacterium]
MKHIRASFHDGGSCARPARDSGSDCTRSRAVRPLRERFERMQQEIAKNAPTPEMGLLVRLAMDGLWYSSCISLRRPTRNNNARCKRCF